MDAKLQTFLQKFQHLKINLEDITSATNNFNEKNRIGRGGFGNVYEGELSHSGGRSMVAIKRLNLDPRNLQGTPEFLKEIMMLSRYKHENLISLLGFCYERHEMILVYEHASRGSLENYLNSPRLTWTHRLKICLDAAKGLSYLHDPRGTHQRLIHCDVKSPNILLDDQWNAKVSDFGLSIVGSANEQNSVIITLAAGTVGYIDPQYRMTHTLTKESDVYSFGVVLFEVLCGRLCYTLDSNHHIEKILVPTWIASYQQKKLNEIIYNDLTIPLDKSALEIFSDIAYRCLNESREDRPTMAEVVTELENALEIHELPKSQKSCEWKETISYYEEIIKTAEPPLNYRTTVKLWVLLSKGVLLNEGKTWFSLNDKGEHCEMISCGACIIPSVHESYPWSSGYNSRFPVGTYHSVRGRFKTTVRSQFLSPHITYTVNIVFKTMLPEKASNCHLMSLKYRLQGETKKSTSYLVCEREDGWWMAELYQFTSDRRSVDLEILFDGFDRPFPVIEVEGIEFRPLEKVDEKQPISDPYVYWEEKLPNDYEDIIKLSKNSVQSTTKKEVYSIFCRGFLINDDQEWFSLDKNGKKCYMLSATAAGIEGEIRRWRSLPKSRFGEVVELKEREFKIVREINYQLLSFQTYATYLVYKLPRDQSRYEAPVEVIEVVDEERSGSDRIEYFYLRSHQTPVIKPKAYQYTHNPLHRPKIKGIPEQRDDGWMEVQIWQLQTTATSNMIHVSLKLTTCGAETLKGLIIEGVELRPV
ncbi:putative protein kinase RLK-Pelle-CrRLK1L-1 family [Helianthus annuus]|nr:putative protein kinase RLK-Pelle-CrRLK1L-1 family [Helianthus annuus]